MKQNLKTEIEDFLKRVEDHKEVLTIDRDLINELRLRGFSKGWIGINILEPYYNSIQKEKKQNLKEVIRKDRLIKKHFKVCVNCNRQAVKGITLCETCQKKQKEYLHSEKGQEAVKKYYDNNREKVRESHRKWYNKKKEGK